MNPIRLISATICALALNAFALHAQLPKPGSQPRDPFLKDRGAPATAPDTSENLTALTVMFETYALNQSDAAGLLTLAPDAATRYTRVNELVAAGRARLANVAASATKSGKHATAESIDVVQLASQFYPPLRREDPPVAASLNEAHYGDRAEFDAILGADGHTCNLNFTVVVDRLLGFREYRTGVHGQPQPLPINEKRQILTSVALRTGEPVFLGTLNPAAGVAQEGGDMAVVFGRVLVDKDRPETPMPALGAVGYAEHVLIFYSMDRTTARDLMAGNTKPGAAFAAVRTLADKKQARLEHIVSVPSQAGVLAKTDENIISQQPGGTSPLVGLAEIPQSRDEPDKRVGFHYVRTMSGKNLGLSVELDSVVGPADALLKGLPLAADLNVNLWWRADLGSFKAAGALALYPETSAAESRHLQHSLTCYVGVPTLLGTISPPRDTGVNERKDTGRTWLVFVKVTPVKP
jgi:hypothetical protein